MKTAQKTERLTVFLYPKAMKWLRWKAQTDELPLSDIVTDLVHAAITVDTAAGLYNPTALMLTAGVQMIANPAAARPTRGRPKVAKFPAPEDLTYQRVEQAIYRPTPDWHIQWSERWGYTAEWIRNGMPTSGPHGGELARWNHTTKMYDPQEWPAGWCLAPADADDSKYFTWEPLPL